MTNSFRSRQGAIFLICTLALFAALILPAIVKADPVGRQGLVPTAPWFVAETLTTSYTCHNLQTETSAGASDRTFGWTAGPDPSAAAGICVAIGATTATTGSLVCGSAGVPMTDPARGDLVGDAAIQDFCWRSTAGSVLATFAAEW